MLDRLAAKYHLVCVNYDGFDGGGSIFPDMQHEQWLFGGEQYTVPVLETIDEFMDTPV